MSEIEWARLTAADLRALAAKDAVLILPVASMEQHGPHLPTAVDTILVGAIAKRAARIASPATPVVVAPTVWFGLAEHHMDFGGTFTVSFATFAAVLRDLVGSATRHGFRRILLLNGHGGNISAMDVMVTELTREFRIPVATATYWLLIPEALRATLEDQITVLHACEAETSMILALAPDLVAADRLGEAKGSRGEAAEELLASGIKRWRGFKELTATGVIGDARRASAAKGEKLLAASAEALAHLLTSGKIWPAKT
ncbi:MAG: creatininase family protein [Alphaproteobacteria bacterium]|nr:creatininase family protein [Alphaproteobacteria bacterium]